MFVIVLDYVLKRAVVNEEERFRFTLVKRQSRRIKASVLTDCDFADDIVLMSNEENQAQIFFNDVERKAKNVGLHINKKKTKFLSLNQRKVPKISSTDGNNNECVDDCK